MSKEKIKQEVWAKTTERLKKEPSSYKGGWMQFECADKMLDLAIQTTIEWKEEEFKRRSIIPVILDKKDEAGIRYVLEKERQKTAVAIFAEIDNARGFVLEFVAIKPKHYEEIKKKFLAREC